MNPREGGLCGLRKQVTQASNGFYSTSKTLDFVSRTPKCESLAER